jgi:hypothetical protein
MNVSGTERVAIHGSEELASSACAFCQFDSRTTTRGVDIPSVGSE